MRWPSKSWRLWPLVRFIRSLELTSRAATQRSGITSSRRWVLWVLDEFPNSMSVNVQPSGWRCAFLFLRIRTRAADISRLSYVPKRSSVRPGSAATSSCLEVCSSSGVLDICTDAGNVGINRGRSPSEFWFCVSGAFHVSVFESVRYECAHVRINIPVRFDSICGVVCFVARP